ncbi:FKBP-type peptidyl-prolyl cis-trans isomerase [Rubrivirga marina]|uniref:Peptidyl-prolyl cis-trans isomerase n=1 Tax=Rubrivirga marina TaxID=1196024 RepID=A0A271J3B8_9BACT|nr:peptidylprolyl isomerase [Rubrivirga marina]PAP77787.1 peptidylprolyl isomerase [Rubrivirga marina]
MPAQPGDQVSVHYAGRLDDGTPFDSSEGREPLQFTLGSGQVVAGFDEAVTGMEVGEDKTVRLDPEAAYGERRDDLVLEVPKSAFPDDATPSVGQGVRLGLQGGGAVEARVVEVEDQSVTLDANHPLAGQALTFDLTLVDVAD